jgi:hypothetical protein
MSAQSTVELNRASKFTDRIRSYQVFVDGEEVGKIKNGEHATFSVAPGRHEVKLKIDWTESPPVTIDASPGGSVRLTCSPRANPFTAMYYILFARTKYLRLDPVS